MLVTLIVVIIIILYLSYLFSKLVAKNSFHMNTKGKGIKLLDRVVLGTDRSIDIIQVNERYFLIGNTATNMICLAELSKEDVAFEKKEYDMENGSKLFQNSMIEKWKTKIKK